MDGRRVERRSREGVGGRAFDQPDSDADLFADSNPDNGCGEYADPGSTGADRHTHQYADTDASETNHDSARLNRNKSFEAKKPQIFRGFFMLKKRTKIESLLRAEEDDIALADETVGSAVDGGNPLILDFG